MVKSALSMLISSYRIEEVERLSLLRREVPAESLCPDKCEEVPSDRTDVVRDEGLDPWCIEDSDPFVFSAKV